MLKPAPYQLPLWARPDFDIRYAFEFGMVASSDYVVLRAELVRRNLIDDAASSDNVEHISSV